MQTYFAGIGSLDPIITGATMTIIGGIFWITYLCWQVAQEPADDGQD